MNDVKLDSVEDGFARVVSRASGQTLGYVTREKHGSTRTGTRWVATRTRSRVVTLGHGATRAEAVAHVVARARRVGRV